MTISPLLLRLRRQLYVLLSVALYLSAAALVPSMVQASAGLLEINPSGDSYQAAYSPPDSLVSGDRLFLEVPKDYYIVENQEVSAFDLTIGTSVEPVEATDYQVLWDYSDHSHAIVITLPQSAEPMAPITFSLGSGSPYSLRNPYVPGPYTFTMRAEHDGTESLPASDNVTIEESAAPVMLTGHRFYPEIPMENGGYSLELGFTTASPLKYGDYVRLSFPEGTVFRFDSDNVFDFEGKAIQLSDSHYHGAYIESLDMDGTRIGFRITSALLTGTEYNLYLSPGAVEFPPGSQTMQIMTNVQNIPADATFDIGPNNLTVTASDTRLNAKMVDYTYTYIPHEPVDSANTLLLGFPYPMSYDLDEFNTGNVQINGTAPSAVELQGEYLMVTPPAGTAYDAGSTVEILLKGAKNPSDMDGRGTYEFTLTTPARETNGEIPDRFTIWFQESAEPGYSPDPFGHALEIKSGEYLTIPDQPSNGFNGLMEFFSIGMWVRPSYESAGSASTLFHKPGGEGELDVKIGIDADGYLTGSADNMTMLSQAPLPVGQWSHIVLEKSGGGLELFVNGVEEDSFFIESSTYADLTASPSPVYVGASGDAAAQEPFSGYIDDLFISNLPFYYEEMSGLDYYYYTMDGLYFDPEMGFILSYFPFEPGDVLQDRISLQNARFHAAEIESQTVWSGMNTDGRLPNPMELQEARYSVWSAAGHYGTLNLLSASGYSPDYTYTAFAEVQGEDIFTYAISKDYVTNLYNLKFTVAASPPTDPADAALVKFTLDGYGFSGYQLPVSEGQDMYTVNMLHSDPTYVTITPVGKPGQTVYRLEDGTEDPVITGIEADLAEGGNPFYFKVVSPDGSAEKHYTLIVHWPNQDEQAAADALHTVEMNDPYILSGNASFDEIRYPVYVDLTTLLAETGVEYSWTTDDVSVPPVVDMTTGLLHPHETEAKVLHWVLELKKNDAVRTKSYTVTVLPNLKPALGSNLFAVAYNGQLEAQAEASDPEEQSLYFRLDTRPVHGTIDDELFHSGGYFRYVPNPGLTGPVTDTFTYTVSDGIQETTGMVWISVAGPTPGTSPATVTAITYNGTGTFDLTDNRITLSGLPGGSYTADLLMEFSDSGTIIHSASLASGSVTLEVYGDRKNIIRLPLTGGQTDVNLLLQDNNGYLKSYTMTVIQNAVPGQPPAAPLLTLGMVETSGRYLTLRFDTVLHTADPAGIRYRIGMETYLAAGAYIDSTDHHRLKVSLGSPVPAGSSVTLVMNAGAVMSGAGGLNGEREAPLSNLSLTTGSSSPKTSVDVADLLQLPDLEALPGEVIREALNLVTPHYLAP